jgi:hypothetical protein
MAGFELGKPVQALSGGVRHPGDHRGGDLVLPAGNVAGQRDELGDVVVLSASVIEGEEPVAYLAFAGRGAGHPRPQVQRVAELFLRDPGGGDLLPVPVTVQGVDDLGELVRAQVLQVARAGL